MSGIVRVLIVDDHPIFRKGLADLINDEPGMVVCDEAATGAAALDAVAAHRPDVAVVDLSLGAENGLDLVAALAKLHPPVRVLVLSGHDERLYAERALKAGALGYIMKVQAETELVTALRRVTGGQSYVSPDVAERILSGLGGKRSGTEKASIDRLSDRERHVLTLIGHARSTREIAEQLDVSVKTVETHYGRIKQKLGMKSGRELIRFAVNWTNGNPL